MPAARKHATLAVASLALLAAFALAGSASGIALPGPKDRKAPSAPTNVRVTSATPTSVSLAWDSATDNVSVAFYFVYVDAQRARVSGTTYTATNLQCGQSIGVWIVAYDTSLNRSSSATATVSTAACLDMQAPTPPSGFRQAATTETGVVLEWDNSSDDVGVVGYGVYRNQLLVQSTSQPSATLTGLVCGSTFEHQVDAVDAAGNRSARRSAWVQTAPCPAPLPPPGDTTQPSQPATLRVSGVALTSVTLAWSPATDNVGVAGYDVYKNGAKMAFVTSTSSTQGGLACGSSNWFGVEALDAAGNRSARVRTQATTSACAPPPSGGWTYCAAENQQCTFAGTKEVRYGANGTFTTPRVFNSTVSCNNATFGDPLRGVLKRCEYRDVGATPPPPSDTSPADQTPPSQPANLAVQSVTTTSVSLAWGASTDNVGVTGYDVYVNGNSVLTASQPGATIPSLTCGTAFTFAVDAFDKANNRSTKAQVTASTAACGDTQAPTSPTNVAASSRTATSIALIWSASTDNRGVTGYGLYRAGTLTGTSSTTTGIFSGLSCNTNYTLAVDAQDAAGNRSGKTTVMVATTACADTTAPSSPTGLAVSNVTQSSLTLGWNASTDNVGVVSYEVFRNGTKMESTASRSSSQTGLACSTSYFFGVEALDAAGNHSPRVSVNPTTSACPPPPTPPPAPAPPPPPAPSGPITITQGGTYSGTWVGTGAGPAVRIATSAPVTIENSTIRNTGAAPLIDANHAGAQLTVRRSTLEGAPGSVGKAVYSYGFKSVRVENCTINFTWGIRLDAIQAGGTIVVTKNKGRNMVRNPSDYSHFFQAANHTQQPAQIDVSWNEIINTFGQSGVEDVLSMHGAGYAKIHDNYIQGAYPDALGSGYSGSGIMLDSGAHDNEIYNNIIVDTVNAGIGIASGWNNSVHDNRMVFDGRDDAGNLFAAANIGTYVWNYDANPNWANNHSTNNSVGWIKANGQRNDMWFPDAPSADYGTNTMIPNPVTRQTEQAEYQSWLGKLASNGITVGA